MKCTPHTTSMVHIHSHTPGEHTIVSTDTGAHAEACAFIAYMLENSKADYTPNSQSYSTMCAQTTCTDKKNGDSGWRLFGPTETLSHARHRHAYNAHCAHAYVQRAYVVRSIHATLARILNASHKQLNINYLFCYSPKNYTDCAFVYIYMNWWIVSGEHIPFFSLSLSLSLSATSSLSLILTHLLQ